MKEPILQEDVQIWIDFIFQQIAAESYFDGVDIKDEKLVAERLVNGANNWRVPLPTDESDRQINRVRHELFLVFW